MISWFCVSLMKLWEAPELKPEVSLFMLHWALTLALAGPAESKQRCGSQAWEAAAGWAPGFDFGKVGWASGEEGLCFKGFLGCWGWDLVAVGSWKWALCLSLVPVAPQIAYLKASLAKVDAFLFFIFKCSKYCDPYAGETCQRIESKS